MPRLTVVAGICAGLGAVLVLVAACDPQASKDASLPCKNDVECASGLACLPTRNGLSGECMQPACSKRCDSDDDCKAMRYSSDNKDCFVCKDVSACPLANASTGDAGVIKACVDRCEAVPAR